MAKPTTEQDYDYEIDEAGNIYYLDPETREVLSIDYAEGEEPEEGSAANWDLGGDSSEESTEDSEEEDEDDSEQDDLKDEIQDRASEEIKKKAGEDIKKAGKNELKKLGEKALVETLPVWGPWALGCLVIVVIAIVFFLIIMAIKPDPASGSELTQTIIALDPGHPSEDTDSYTQAQYNADQAKWEKDKTGANGGTASKSGVQERVINQQVSDKLKTELEARGYKVIMTKTDADQFVSNRERGKKAKQGSANVILKIHNDGDSNPSKKGITFYTSNKTIIQEKSNMSSGTCKSTPQACKNELGEMFVARKDETIAEDKKLNDALLKAFKQYQTDKGIKYGSGSNYPSNTMPHPKNLSFGYTYNIPSSTIELSDLGEFEEDANFIKDGSNQGKVAQAIAAGLEAYIPPTGGGSGLCKPLKPADPKSSKGFVQLPKSKEYDMNGGSPSSEQWGSPELVSLLESVATEWNKRHPEAKITYGDLSKADGQKFGSHVSHVAGVDVDVNSNTSPAFIMTKGGYDKKLAIELAELFMDTKADVYVLYNDGSIYDEVNSYAKKKGLPGQMKYWDNHENHFHVRIDPSAYSKACGFTESAAGKIGDAWLSARGQDLD